MISVFNILGGLWRKMSGAVPAPVNAAIENSSKDKTPLAQNITDARTAVREADQSVDTSSRLRVVDGQINNVPKNSLASIGLADVYAVKKSSNGYEFELKNGLRVILYPDFSKPSFELTSQYHVGSKDDTIPGIAHLLEHMAFETPSGIFKKGDFNDLVEYNGGSSQGCTTVDSTSYTVALNKQYLNLAIEIAFAIMDRLDLDPNNPELEAELQKEISVVLAEMDWLNDNAGVQVANALLKQMYTDENGSHNYAKPGIGYKETVSKITLKLLKEFYKSKYKPNNCTLIFTGNFGSPKDLLKKLNDKFGSLKAGRKETISQPVPQHKTIPAPTKLKKEGKDKIMNMAFKVPNASHEDYPALQILSRLLALGADSHLYTRLVKDLHGDIPYLEASLGTRKDDSSFHLYAELGELTDFDKVEHHIGLVLNEIRKNGITEDELKRIKDIFIAAEIHSMDRDYNEPGSMLSQLTRLREQSAWDKIDDIERFLKVTSKDIQDVLDKYLLKWDEKKNRYVMRDHYKVTLDSQEILDQSQYEKKQAEKALKAAQSKAIETKKSEKKDVARFKALTDKICPEASYKPIDLKLEKYESGNCNVTIKKDHKLDLAYLQGRSFKQPLSQKEQYIGKLALTMLFAGGTHKRDKYEIADIFKRCGAAISFWLTKDGLNFQVCTTTKNKNNLQEISTLFKEYLNEPYFNARDFYDAQRGLKEALKKENTRAHIAGGIALNNKIYPEGHNYRTPDIMTRWKMIDEITYDDVINFYNKFFKDPNSKFEIAAVGKDWDKQSLENGFIQPLNNWLNSPAPKQIINKEAKKATENFRQKAKQIDLKELEKYSKFKNANQQALLLYGLNCKVPVTHEDFYPLSLAIDILGGSSLSSRLGSLARDQKGLVYDIGAYFRNSLKHEGPFVIESSCAMDKIDELRAVVDHALKGFPDNITDDELEMAKSSIIKSYEENGFSTMGDTVSELSYLGLMAGDQKKFVKNFPQMINSLTKEQVINAFKKHIDLSKVHKIIVDKEIRELT